MSIFISYSRNDGAFVRRLHTGLASRGRDTWVDWEGIPPTADWMNEIYGAIDAADAVVFVLSPDSIASPVCAQELAHAVAQQKRLIPVVARPVRPADTPAALTRLNWIISTDDDLEAAFDTLLAAVDTDLEWVQAHTRLLVRSAEWDRHRREGSFALRGSDLKAAEQWLTQGPTKAPPPTELQTRYIIESRRQATTRRYILLGGVTVALVVTAVLGTLSVLQRNEAARQQAMRDARRLAATAERVRDANLEYSNDTSRVDLSVQLAAEALRRVDTLDLRSVEADLVMRRGLALLPERMKRLDADGIDGLDALVFGRGGEIVATSDRTSATVVWNADGVREGGKAGSAGAGKMILSPDGHAFALVEPGEQQGVVEVYETRTHRLLGRMQGDATVAYAAVGPGAKYIVITEEGPTVRGGESTRLQMLPGPKEIVRLSGVSFPAFSADGAYLAGVTGDQLQVWSVERLASGIAAPLRSLAADAPAAGPPHFSPDGTHLVAAYGDASRIAIWTVGDWKRVQDFDGPADSFVAGVGPGARTLGLAQAYSAGYRLLLVDGVNHCSLGQIVVDARDPVIAFAVDRPVVAAASAGHVDVFRLQSRCGFARHVEGISNAVATAFNADSGELAVVSRRDKTPTSGLALYMVNSVTGQSISTTKLAPANLMKFSADGRWLVLVSQTQVRVVDVADGRERASFPAPAVVDEVAIAADASVVVTVTGDRTLRAWGGSPMREVSATALPALPEELAPGFTAIDASRFLFFTHLTTRIGDRLTMRFWNLAAMSEPASQPVGRDRGGFAATVCGVSGDGHLLAVNARGIGVILRNLENSAELGVVSESSGDKSCRFSSDGRYVAVLPDLGVWDIATQAEVSRIEAPASVIDAALSHDDRYLAMVSDKGEVSIAPLRPRDLIAEACARLANDISEDDWQRYVGNEPVRAACVAPN